MPGTNCNLHDGKIAGREFLRIEGDGVPSYSASPKDARTVVFKLVRHSPYEAIFENAEHDFPQRIA